MKTDIKQELADRHEIGQWKDEDILLHLNAYEKFVEKGIATQRTLDLIALYQEELEFRNERDASV